MRVGCFRTGGVGNAVNFTPALSALRQLFPQCSIECIVAEGGAEVLSGWGLIDRVIPFRERDLHDLLFLSSLRRFEIVLVGRPCGPESKDIACFGRKIIGGYTAGSDAKQHEVLVNIDLVRELGWKGVVPRTHVHVDERADRVVERELGRLLNGCVAIHPGCSEDFLPARWPTQRWIEFCYKIRKELWTSCVVVGGVAGADVANDICLAVPWALNLCGRLSLKETAAALRRVRLFVSNDSGLGHIAAAVGTPIISLFGPTSPASSRPWASRSAAVVIRSRTPCAPCFGKPDFVRCREHVCMRSIRVEEVVHASADLLCGEIEQDTSASEGHLEPHKTPAQSPGTSNRSLAQRVVPDVRERRCPSAPGEEPPPRESWAVSRPATSSTKEEQRGLGHPKAIASETLVQKYWPPRIPPKVAILVLAGDEADVIRESITENLKYADLFLVLVDSTDGTAEICEEILGRDAVRRTRQKFHVGIRDELIWMARNSLTEQDWLFFLDADELFDQDPGPFVKAADDYGAYVMEVQRAQFYLTERDLKRLEADPDGERSRPVKGRLRYYSLNWTECKACRNLPGLAFVKADTCPSRWKGGSTFDRVWRPGPLTRHYQFRTPEQIQRRLDRRLASRASGAAPFKHYTRSHWHSYIIDSSLLYECGGEWRGPGIPLERLLAESHLTLAGGGADEQQAAQLLSRPLKEPG